MGLESEIDATEDIGAANAILILALNSELKQNPWIRNVARFHNLPIFVLKMVNAVQMILGMNGLGPQVSRGLDVDIEIEDDAPKRKPSLEEIDALKVRMAIEYHSYPWWRTSGAPSKVFGDNRSAAGARRKLPAHSGEVGYGIELQAADSSAEAKQEDVIHKSCNVN